MTNPTQTAVEILTQAAETLTEEEWNQDSFFSLKIGKGKVVHCRCAHGQIQWCGRGVPFQQEFRRHGVREQDRFDQEAEEIAEIDLDFILDTSTGVEVAVKLSRGKLHNGLNLEGVLTDFRLNFEETFNEPLFLAHYYAAKVGLTFAYNDEEGRSFPEIIAKLKEAATLAAADEEVQ